MFDISPVEMLVILLVGLIVVGPEKLPRMIRDGARWLRDLRRTVASARQDLKEQLGPELSGLDVRDLDPRHYVRTHVLDGLDDEEDEPTAGRRRSTNGSANGSGISSGSSSAATGFDPDTT